MDKQLSGLGAGPRVRHDPFFTSSPFEPTIEPPSSLDEIDLTDPNLLRHGDPHAVWNMLREQAPVFWHEKPTHGTRGQGFWAITTYTESNEIHRRTDLFTATDTVFMDLLPEDIPRQLSMVDPPEHSQFRRAVAKFFSSKAIERTTDDVHAIIAMVLDSVAGETQEFNFYDRVAAQIPFMATANLFQMPPTAAQELGAALQNLQYGGSDPLKAYTEQVIAFFDEYTTGWQRGQSDSIIGAVLDVEVDGSPMSRAEALANLWILFTGALDTTAHAMSIGMLTLFHHPDQFERLRNDRSLIPSAVTELLRWTATSNVVKHRVTADTELGGRQLRAGDYVATYPPSSNRDASVFVDPFRFDVGRGQDTPIATFGGGPHLCLGHHFARLELRIFLEELLTRIPTIQQAGPASRGEAFTMILSPLTELPVRLGAPA